MAATVNKRQQARNERTLQDLIRNVPGNDHCADCSARNPGWSSWSLGIFLCMRCASIHRKLGVHLSKVKSLSMDTWTTDQVEQMKTMGNTTSNQKFNPRNIKPNLPIDADEVDMTMEKFIRQKYQTRTLSAPAVRSLARTDTGSTGSSDDRPPQVPAKDSPRSSISSRALSSTYSGSRIDRPLPPIAESRDIGGSTNGSTSSNNATDDALARLKSMGFANERRNTAVLKGLNNDFDRAVQTLLRLGEGGHASETLRQQYPASQTSGSQSSRQASQTSQSTGPNSQIHSLPSQNSFHPQQTASPVDTWNPFNATNQQLSPQPTPPIEASFQTLSLSNPGFQSQSTSSAQAQTQTQNNPFLKAFTPPISPAPYHQPYSTIPPPLLHQHSHYQTDTQTTNPFLRHSRSQNFMTSNDANSAYQPSINAQPLPMMPPIPQYAQQQYRSFSQPQLQQPQIPGSTYPQSDQQQQAYPQTALYSPPVQSPLSQTTASASDFPFQTPPTQQQNQIYPTQQFDQDQPSQQYNPPYYTTPSQPQNPYQTINIPQQLQPQQTGRHTKSSILALYNTPNPPHPTTQHPQPQRSASMPLPNTIPTTAPNTSQQSNSGTHDLNGKINGHTIPSPTSQTRNPFGKIGIAGMSNGLGHIREESREFTSLNGRHSPDAFVGLSARAR